MKPTLTIILIADAEKDRHLVDCFFASLRRWNRAGLRDVQMLAICQHPKDRHAARAAVRQPYPVDVVFPRHDIVEGYPVWDVCDELASVWSLVRGRYITVMHPEFLWLPERLPRTLDYLKREEPMVALGNLRWPARRFSYGDDEAREQGRNNTLRVLRLLRKQEWYAAGALAESMPNCGWMANGKPVKAGSCDWREDVFFVRRSWVEAVGILDDLAPMPFQDIFDIIGATVELCGRYGVAPLCERIDPHTNSVLHLWHRRAWGSWTPAMRHYFLDNPGRWDGTSLVRPELWDHLCGSDRQEQIDAVAALRRGRDGTLTNFIKRMERRLLRQKGAENMLDYFESVYGESYSRTSYRHRHPNNPRHSWLTTSTSRQ